LAGVICCQFFLANTNKKIPNNNAGDLIHLKKAAFRRF
jgi:hypothetical protein